MNSVWGLFLALAFVTLADPVRSSENDKFIEIKEDIMKRYNKADAPPKREDGNPFKVNCMVVGLAFRSMDLRTGVLHMKLYHATNWRDGRLAYKQQLQNTTRADRFIAFATDEIWNPVFHAWNGFIHQDFPGPLLATPGGVVFQPEPINTETLCGFSDASYFPYDQHKCDIVYSKFDNRGQSLAVETQMYLHHLGDPENPWMNHVWRIKHPSYKNEIYKDRGGFEHQAVRLRFTLSREDTTFIWTAICSALAALFASSLSHLVPPSDGTLVRLTLSGFSLTILACVNLFFQHYTPLDIERPPILYTLCNVSFAIVLISILKTIVANAILTRSTISVTLKNPLCRIATWVWGWSEPNREPNRKSDDKRCIVEDEEEGDTDYTSFANTTCSGGQSKGVHDDNAILLVLVLDFYLFLTLQIIFVAFVAFLIFISMTNTDIEDVKYYSLP